VSGVLNCQVHAEKLTIQGSLLQWIEFVRLNLMLDYDRLVNDLFFLLFVV
jgi:hypothetical protein